MFGLMQNKGCLNDQQPDWYRLHYCGSCKALGSTYGQKSRVLLNYDLVFLSEILSLLGQKDTQSWNPKIADHNCFNLPDSTDIPLHLQYIADVNMLLASLKIIDNRQDENPIKWKLIQRFYNGPINKMSSQLERWNIDQGLIQSWQKEGDHLEKHGLLFDKKNQLEYRLVKFSQSTAKITAYLFSKGLEAIAVKEDKELIAKIGFSFGELTYTLDAWKDLEEDLDTGKFNPASHLIEAQNMDGLKTEMKNFIWKKAEQIKLQLAQLSIDHELIHKVKVRLDFNLDRTFGSAPVFYNETKSGIEKSTVPQLINQTRFVLRSFYAWLDPSIPKKFLVTYFTGLIFFFNQQIAFAVESFKNNEMANSNAGWLSYFAIALAPIGLYYVARKVKKEKYASRIEEKLKKKKEKLQRRINRLLKRRGEGKKLKWWHWLLIIIGGILVLFLLLIIIAISSISAGGSSCGSGGNSGCSGGGGNSSCC